MHHLNWLNVGIDFRTANYVSTERSSPRMSWLDDRAQ